MAVCPAQDILHIRLLEKDEKNLVPTRQMAPKLVLGGTAFYSKGGTECLHTSIPDTLGLATLCPLKVIPLVTSKDKKWDCPRC